MAEFGMPGKTIYGSGCLNRLRGISGKRAMLVCGCPEAEGAVSEELKETKMIIRPFYTDNGFAYPKAVYEGTKALMEFKPDWVVAVGGSGAIYTAKLMCIMYQHPELNAVDLVSGKASSLMFEKLGFVSIPTLGSLGSEASSNAVLTSFSDGFEAVIQCRGFLPRMVIIDTRLAPLATEWEKSCGIISTLALAVEATVAKGANQFTKPYSGEAIRLVAKNTAAYFTASKSQGSLLYAQYLAGIAHENCDGGACSALIHAVSPALDVPMLHGAMASVIMPVLLDSIPQEQQYRYDPIAEGMEISTAGMSSPESIALLIREYSEMLGLPATFEEAGVDKNMFIKKLSRISKQAAESKSIINMFPNDPAKAVEQLLRRAYFSKPQ